MYKKLFRYNPELNWTNKQINLFERLIKNYVNDLNDEQEIINEIFLTLTWKEIDEWNDQIKNIMYIMKRKGNTNILLYEDLDFVSLVLTQLLREYTEYEIKFNKWDKEYEKETNEGYNEQYLQDLYKHF